MTSQCPLSVYERVFSQAGAIESTTVTLGTTEHLTKTYSQDNRGQVISEAYFSGSSPSSQHTTRSYGPDAAGNRALEVIQSQTHHHTIERDNRLVSDSRWSYTHDDEGNVTSKTSADGKSLWQYAWDHRNRLIEATLRYDAGGNVSATSSITRTVNQTYDGLDRWIGSENSETGENHLYVHDSGQLTLEFVDGAVENRYLWAAGVDQLLAEDGAAANEEPRWTLTDHLGSVRDVVSETTSLSHTDYDAFGNVEGTAADLLFGYTARPYDESTDLQNNHHRWYDSEIGRWMSHDPSGLEPDANPYRYVSNQPMTLTDPSGLEPPIELPSQEEIDEARRRLGRNRVMGGIALSAHGNGLGAGALRRELAVQIPRHFDANGHLFTGEYYDGRPVFRGRYYDCFVYGDTGTMVDVPTPASVLDEMAKRVLSKNTNENIVRQITVQSQRSVTIFRPKLWPDFSEWNAFAAQNSRSAQRQTQLDL